VPQPTQESVPAGAKAPTDNHGDTARYGFEDGTTQGWAIDKGALAPTTEASFKGRGALSAALDLDKDKGDMCFLSNKTVDAASSPLVFHLKPPSACPGLTAKVFIQDPAWKWTDAGVTPLKAGVWNTLSFKNAPAPRDEPCRRVGVCFECDRPFKGKVLLDSIEVPVKIVPSPTPVF